MSQEGCKRHHGNRGPPPSLSPRGKRWLPRGRHICAEQTFQKLFENYIWRPVNIDLPNETSLFSNLKTNGIYPVVQLCQADRSRASFSPKATQELYHILLPHPQSSSEWLATGQGVFLSLLPWNPLAASFLLPTAPKLPDYTNTSSLWFF